MVELEHHLQAEERSTECQSKEQTSAGSGLDKNLTGVQKFDNQQRTAEKVEELFTKLQNLRKVQDEQRCAHVLSPSRRNNQVGAAERDSAVTRLKSMKKYYNYHSETLALAVSYLDRFISKMKVQKRYLSCVTAAAFFLATKMNEETEFHPTASDLAILNKKSWSPSDLKRMELIMLEKLEWNLYPAATSVSFIEVIYQLLQLVHESIDDTVLKMLLERIEFYLNYSSCSRFGACTLALSVTQQCLKELGLYSQMTSYLFYRLLPLCRVSDTEFYECQCAISHQQQLYNLHPKIQPRCLPVKARSRYRCSTKLQTIPELPLWNCDVSEEEAEKSKVLVTCDMNQYYGPRNSKMTWSYCLLLDQCPTTQQSGQFCEIKCNTSYI